VNHWPFIIAAYAIAAVAVSAVTASSWTAMRRAEAEADSLGRGREA